MAKMMLMKMTNNDDENQQFIAKNLHQLLLKVFNCNRAHYKTNRE